MNDFLPTLVSIKREYLQKSTKIRQNLHAIGCSQKNPRRAHGLTGINANYSKLKYGEGEIRTLDTVSRMQSFQDCALNHSATSPKVVFGIRST